MQKHISSNKYSKTLDEIESSIPVIQVLGLANNIRGINSNNRLEHRVTV